MTLLKMWVESSLVSVFGLISAFLWQSQPKMSNKCLRMYVYVGLSVCTDMLLNLCEVEGQKSFLFLIMLASELAFYFSWLSLISRFHSDFPSQALMENTNLSFVKPAWIYAINERQKMLPYQPYSVVPWTEHWTYTPRCAQTHTCTSRPDEDTVRKAIDIFSFSDPPLEAINQLLFNNDFILAIH